MKASRHGYASAVEAGESTSETPVPRNEGQSMVHSDERLAESGRHLRDIDRRRLLLASIPPDGFSPYSADVARIIAWIALIVIAQVVLLTHPQAAVVPATIAGIGMGLVVFLAHDLSHGTIVRGKLQYPLEVVAWGVNGFPATLWRVLHNKWHHKFANTPNDSDRIFILEERSSPLRRVYAFLFLPLRESGAIPNPLMLLAFFAYTLKYTAASLLNRKLTICTGQPHFRIHDRARIFFEVVVASAAYGALVTLSVGMGNSIWYAIILHVAVPLMVASAIAMAFIFTQHIGNPILDRTDTIASSTSLRVPRLIQILTSNVAFHVEHHLFPRMNPRHYRELSRVIVAAWPDEYRQLSFWQAWRNVLRSPAFRAVERRENVASPVLIRSETTTYTSG